MPDIALYFFIGTACAAFILGHNAGRGKAVDAATLIAAALVWLFWPAWLLVLWALHAGFRRARDGHAVAVAPEPAHSPPVGEHSATITDDVAAEIARHNTRLEWTAPPVERPLYPS